MDDAMIEKVAKLLNKAERATTEAEAEAFFAKAFELQQKYALDDMLIQAKRVGSVKPEEILEKKVQFKGSYAQAQIRLGHAVAGAVNCRSLQSNFKSTYNLHIVGYESDVARAETLIASLMIQAQRSLNNFGATIPAYYSAFEKFRERRDFWMTYAGTVGARMTKANQTATAEYVAERAASGEDEGALRTSMAVALRDRKDSVNDWVDRTYGRLRYTSSRMSGGFGHGSAAGREAGSRADIGQGRMGPGGPKQLGR